MRNQRGGLLKRTVKQTLLADVELGVDEGALLCRVFVVGAGEFARNCGCAHT
jgi:hypothetical protein